MKNGNARLENNDLCLPIIDSNDPNDPGGMMRRYLDKISPGQVRFHCEKASEEAKRRHRMFGHANPSIHHLKPLGKTSVSNGVKEIAQQLDLEDWKCFGGQALRAFVGNDDSANASKSIAASRHNCASAHKHCDETSSISETSKHKALGLIKK